MKEELEKEVVDTETSDDAFFSDLSNEEEEDETDEEEEYPDEAEEDTEEAEESPRDKTEEWTPEELRKAYKNLETLVGKQGQELGELRKKVTVAPAEPEEKKQYNENDIPNMPDNVLESYIATYKQWLSTPGISIEESDRFGQMTVQYQELLAERNARRTLGIAAKKALDDVNSAVVTEYKNKASLTDEEAKKALDFAIKKLSDDGKVTQDDLDVAVHKLFPEKYHKLRFDKEKERLAKAGTRTPTIPNNNRSSEPSKISLEKINKMDSDEYDAYVESLTDSQYAELKKLIKR